MANDREITLIIQSGQGSNEFTFPQQTKVRDAASRAATALGYPANGSYQLVYGDEVLADQRTLVSYGLEDGAILILAATGSGV